MVIPTETPSVMLRIVPLSTRLAELLLASIADMLLLLPMVIPTEMLTVTEATATLMEIATAQAITTPETIMEAATITAHLPADTARRPSASAPTTPSATPPQEQLPLRNATLGRRRFASWNNVNNPSKSRSTFIPSNADLCLAVSVRTLTSRSSSQAACQP